MVREGKLRQKVMEKRGTHPEEVGGEKQTFSRWWVN